jgi:hypothetical protein
MAYVYPNVKTKAALRRAIKAGVRVTVYEPGFGNAPNNGKVHVEGPHYPQAHTWYGTATVEDGVVVRIK